MPAFGAVPGLTVFSTACVVLLGACYLGVAAVISQSESARRIWKRLATVVVLMFALTTAVVLITTIVENQYTTRITGG